MRTVWANDTSDIRLAQPRCRLDKRIEHGLQIEGRSADDLEHVGGGGLLLERLAQLVEQTGVFDGDDRLLRKIAYQLDLFLAERPHLLAVNADDADRLIFLDHRDAK